MSEWKCEVCDQVVSQAGPWCDLYCSEKRLICLAVWMEARDSAQAQGLDHVVKQLTRILDENYDWRDL